MKKLMLLIAVCFIFVGSLFAQNIIGNASVEDLTPAFWNPVNGTFGAELGVGTDTTTDVKSKFRSFKITKSAATSDIVGWLSDDNANKYWNNAASGTFSIKASIKTVGVNTAPANDDAKIGVLFEFKTAAGVELSSVTLWAVQSAADEDWADFSDVVILSEAPEQVFVTLFMGKDATGTVYFDDIGCGTDPWSMGVFNSGAENVAGWLDWYGGNGNYTMVTDEEAHTGSYSVVLYQDDDTLTSQSELVYYTQPYPVEAGEWYKIGVWVKTEDVNKTGMGEFTYASAENINGGINLCFFTHGGNIETEWSAQGDRFIYVDQRDSTTDWRLYEAVHQASDLATGISVRARFNNWVTGTAWFDDFSVVKMAVAPTAIEPEDEKTTRVPEKFTLLQNYPNPFNPETTIEYALPNQSKVTLTVFNILGQQVRTLTNTVQEAGNYSVVWNASDDLGKAVPTGMYLYVLRTNDQRMTRKMLLIR
ncbi:MAG: T9SS type A sorting domain-containing protein [Candidatus Marinimicrobia bacterium]|nr:T9SS type A sorting domain-containing protein [Candidatus Neomarinimicrobiota bacterium]